MSLTPQQQRAVEAHGKTIVSAAAGSGKTHVMVSRFVRLIIEEHADIRDMLAVTFTNKAAAQMRDRIRRALLEAIAAEKGEAREFLTRQLKNLPLADICTIHAFCGRLLRTYFYLADLDPAFRITGDEDAECAALSGRAMDRAFEEAYEGNVEGFERLLAVYFRKKDSDLRDLVGMMYASVRCDAHYRDTLNAIASNSEDTFDEAAEVIKCEAVRKLRRLYADLLRVGKDLSAVSNPKLAHYYKELEAALSYIMEAADLFDLAGRISERIKGSLPSEKELKNDAERDIAARLYDIRSERLKNIRESVKRYHARDEEYEKYDNGRKQAAALAALTLVYDDMYTAEKREAGVLDYEDLEHLTIQLLGNEEVRDALRKRYGYIFVDEYQDVNPMQEEIVSLLSGKDVFLVGDLKQAIYGFRGSKSQYFAEKEREFETEGNCLPLSANFRSAKAILDAVNTVFTAALPGYAALNGGELYGGYTGEVVLHELPACEEETAKERGVYSVKEAAAMARADRTAERVVAIVEEECGRRIGCGKQYFDTETHEFKEVTYGDIAVLVRKKKETTAAVVRMLSERGIPVTTDAKINICDYFEVRLILDWLSLLDDPEQDIPLASAMLSVIGGFSDGDLAHIRIWADGAGIRGSFRAVCRLYAARHGKGDAQAEKLRAFSERVSAYRDLMRVRTASEMIALLLADGLEAQIAAKGESAMRLGRVRRLIAESETCGDVHSFLARLRNCGYEVDLSEAGGENAVHIATMHASKGLEFPVVILIDLDTAIQGVFKRNEFLWTDKFHFAPRCYDLEKKVCKNTILRDATALYAMQEAIDGERNLLYVAMTRARCRLHMVFSDGPCKYQSAEEEMEHYSVPDAKSLADLIPRLSLHAEKGTAEEAGEPAATSAPLYRPAAELVEKIREAARPYAHAESTLIPVKDSASGLLGRKTPPMYREGEEEEVDTMSEMSTEDAGMGGGYSTEVGTAYHAFLEHAEFGADADAEFERMRGILPPEQLALLDPARVRAILNMPLLKGLAGKKTYREQRFLARFPAREFASSYGAATDDEVMYQGAIDLLVDEGDGRYSVIDYKFSSLSAEKLLRHYAVQLKLYRMTVARVMKCELSQVGVYLVNIAQGYVAPCPL